MQNLDYQLYNDSLQVCCYHMLPLSRGAGLCGLRASGERRRRRLGRASTLTQRADLAVCATTAMRA
jgi:hypothetical protein